VGLEEAHGEEERLTRRLRDQVHGGRCHVVHVVGVALDHVVVAEHRRVAGQVLLADQPRPVARLAQRVDDVVRVVVQREPAVGQTHHPVRVRVLPGEQRRARARARRGGAERLAEQQPLVGQALDVRRRHLMAVGLDEAPRVVRVQVEDVRLHCLIP
jgi:hypothetical protein